MYGDGVHALNTARNRSLLQHRVAASTPIEDTVGAMAKLVDQGKVHYVGLSEATRSVRSLPPVARWREYGSNGICVGNGTRNHA